MWWVQGSKAVRQLLVGLGLLVMASSATAESLQYICEKTRIDAIKIHNAMDALEQQIQEQRAQGQNTQRAEQGLKELAQYLLVNTQIYSDLSCYERGVK